jgi:hypothetical protein
MWLRIKGEDRHPQPSFINTLHWLRLYLLKSVASFSVSPEISFSWIKF